eukprot:TRINITY_DN2900_c0_g3_i2.p1 TRINITY_DN2900_c0_g3~~TRINITY_DN2900_c0_g3_i2.p1  ORF type:complete len:811 (-),score=190.68 TRINITY_DN2900_c0_g3_i2:412-2844(-)
MSFFKKPVSKSSGHEKRFRFSFQVHYASNLPDCRGPLYVEVTRHSKVVSTKKVLAGLDRKATWEETLIMQSSMQQEHGQAGYHEKNAKIFLKDTHKTIGSCKVNLAAFAVSDGKTLDLEFEEYSKRPKPHPMLKITVSCGSLDVLGERRASQITEFSFVTDVTDHTELRRIDETRDYGDEDAQEDMDYMQHISVSQRGSTSHPDASHNDSREVSYHDPLLEEKYDVLLQKYETSLSTIDSLQKQLLELKLHSNGDAIQSGSKDTKNQELEKEVHALKEQIRALEVSLEQKETELEELNDTKDDMESISTNQEKILSVFGKCLDTMKTSQENPIAADVELIEADHAVNSFVKRMNQSITDLQKKLEDSERRMKQMEKERHTEVANVPNSSKVDEAEFLRLEERNRELEMDVAKLQYESQNIADLRSQVALLNTRLSKTQSLLDDREKSIEKMHKDLAKNESIAKQLEDKAEAQEQKIKSLEREKANLDHKFLSSENQVAFLQSELEARSLTTQEEVSKQLSEMNTQCQQYKQKCTTLEQTLELTRKEFQEILQDAQEELKEEAAENAELEEQVSTCASYIQELEDTKSKLENKLESAQKEIADAALFKSNLEGEKRGLERKVETLQATNTEQLAQIRHLESLSATLRENHDEQELIKQLQEEAKSESSRLQAENASLQSKLKSAKDGLEKQLTINGQLLHEIQELKTSVIELRAKCEEKEKHTGPSLEDHEYLQSKIAELELSTRELEKQRDKYHQELSLSKSQLVFYMIHFQMWNVCILPKCASHKSTIVFVTRFALCTLEYIKSEMRTA